MEYTLRDLADAIRSGDQETIRSYLVQGGDPNAGEDGTGITLLHLAAQCRQTDIVKMLLEAGAQVNTLDLDGRSPLCEALNEPPRPGGGVGPDGFQMPGIDPHPAPNLDHSAEIVRLI